MHVPVLRHLGVFFKRVVQPAALATATCRSCRCDAKLAPLDYALSRARMKGKRGDLLGVRTSQ